MNVKEINDDNSLAEVYLQFLIENLKVEVDLIGGMKNDLTFGLYYIWDKDSKKYMLLITDLDKYCDKRAKKKSTKEKRSTLFLYPMDEEYKKVNENTFKEVLKFFDSPDSELFMEFTQDIEFVKTYLKTQ